MNGVVQKLAQQVATSHKLLNSEPLQDAEQISHIAFAFMVRLFKSSAWAQVVCFAVRVPSDARGVSSAGSDYSKDSLDIRLLLGLSARGAGWLKCACLTAGFVSALFHEQIDCERVRPSQCECTNG